MDDAQFHAAAFGPALAQLALDAGKSALTPPIIRRAIRGWNMTGAAMQATIDEAQRLLASPKWVAEYRQRA